jgi:hypothetical protein
MSKFEISERIGKDEKCYHFSNSILWNKNIDRKCKIMVFIVCIKNTLLYGGNACIEREEVNYKQLKFLRAVVTKIRKERNRNIY